MTTTNKTVAAISTPPGKGGVAVIRISGDDAVKIASKVFIPKSRCEVKELSSRYAVYGEIVSDGNIVDDGILTLFRSPASFTGEDTAEICCHGGMLISAKVLQVCLEAGAVAAGPGEFTRRAYLNGKLSLSKTEAIANLLDAKTQAQLSLARNTASGRLSREIQRIYEQMRNIAASVYALVDYPEEDLAEMSCDEMKEKLLSVKDSIKALDLGYDSAKVINEGIETVICGAPNTGKSSLYNALAGKELAIVTDIEGTTRDTLCSEVALGDVLLRISDTAGIRESSDTVEKIGIERSLSALEEAKLVLCVFDGSRELNKEDTKLLQRLKGETEKCVIALINKCECDIVCDTSYIQSCIEHTLFVSAKSGEGLDRLRDTVHALFISDKIDISNDAIISNARQHSCAVSALAAVNDAYNALASGMPPDMAACDIERAMSQLYEIDGQSVSEDITNEIFSKFCVGK